MNSARPRYTPLLLLLGIAIVLPLHARASQNAGIVDGIWFSQSQVLEGTPITIYAAVLNQSSTTASGTITFTDYNTDIGTVRFDAAPDSLTRVSLVHTFTLGQHPVRAAVTQSTSAAGLSFMSVPERSVTVLPRPVVAPAPVAVTSSPTGTRSGNNASNSRTSSTTSSSTPSASPVAAIVQDTGAALGSVTRGITSVTEPLARSLTTTRDSLVKPNALKTVAIKKSTQASTSAASTGPLDVITPTKNLFDVTVDIAGNAGHRPLLSSIGAFLLSVLIWALYCIIPLALLILLIIGFRRGSRRSSTVRSRGSRTAL